jgi:hypothetical protein
MINSLEKNIAMVRWRTIFVPLLIGAACSGWVSVDFWDASRQALLVCLSVIAAGVLVRLARALPFTVADQYELDEIRSLTSAVSQIARSLRALLIAVLVGMIGLVVAKPLLDFAAATPVLAEHLALAGSSISGLLGVVIGYVFFRMLQVVSSDQSLTELQSKFIVRAVERKQAERFEKQQAKFFKGTNE